MIGLAYSTTVIITLLTGVAHHEQTVHLPNVQAQIQDLLEALTEQYRTFTETTEQKLVDLTANHGVQFRSLSENTRTIQSQMTEHFRLITEQTEQKLTEYQRNWQSLTEQMANTLTEHCNRTVSEISEAHAIKSEYVTSQTSTTTEHLTELIHGLNQVVEQTQKQGEALGELTGLPEIVGRLQGDLTEYQRTMAPFIDDLKQVREQSQILGDLTGLPQLISKIHEDLNEHQRTIVEQLTEHRTNIRSLTEHRANRTTEQKLGTEYSVPVPNTEPNTLDKGSFVRQCLTENPNIRNSEIQRKATEHNLTISPAYISEVRKAFENSTEQVS